MKTSTAAGRFDTALHESLLTTIDLLARRRACDIPEQTIARFVAMRWLEWHGGGLRLTPTGESTLVEIQAAMPNLQAA